MTSPSFSVMVNESPKCFFKGIQGLRQRDSLSPYLFIMVADLLGRMMAKVDSVGLVQSFAPNGVGPSIPFIQFADDSLFMLKAEECRKSEVHFAYYGNGHEPKS